MLAFGSKGREVFSMGRLSFPFSSREGKTLPLPSAAAPCCCRTLVFSVTPCKQLSLGKTHFEEGLPLQGFVQGVMLCALFFRGLGVRMISSIIPGVHQLCSNLALRCVRSRKGDSSVSNHCLGAPALGNVPGMGLDELMPLGRTRKVALRGSAITAPPAAASPLDL